MRFNGAVQKSEYLERRVWTATFRTLKISCDVPFEAGVDALVAAVRAEFTNLFGYHGIDVPAFDVTCVADAIMRVSFEGEAVEEAVRFALVRVRFTHFCNHRRAVGALKKKSSGYVRAYESGKRHPKARTLDQLLRVYGAHLSIVSDRGD